jgi:hypothetical protein
MTREQRISEIMDELSRHRNANMKDNRYSITDKNGKSVIAERDGARYIGIDEFAQHIALDIIDDYRYITNGVKQIDETNIELSIKVLNAISPIVTAFRNTSSCGEDC